MAGTIRLRTARLELECYGSTGPGTPLVLLHGNFATWRWWLPVLEQLRGQRRLVAPTMRGCNGTPGGAADYSIEALALDVEAMAEAMELDAFHLVGHSLGGSVALEYALRFPRRVAHLDLVAPAPDDGLRWLLDNGSHTAKLLRGLDPDRPGDRFLLLGMLRMGRSLGLQQRSLRAVLTQLSPGMNHQTPHFEQLVADAAAMDPLAIVGFFQGLKRWRIGERLAQLAMPIRLLAGGRDELVAAASIEALAARLPQAKLTFLPERGHAPMLERPEEFIAWLDAAVQPAPALVPVAVAAVAATVRRAAFGERPWRWATRAWTWLRTWAKRLVRAGQPSRERQLP